MIKGRAFIGFASGASLCFSRNAQRRAPEVAELERLAEARRLKLLSFQ